MVHDSNTISNRVAPTEPMETPPGVLELIKLYEGIEDIYRTAANAMPAYSEWSVATSSTNTRQPWR